MVKIIFKNLQKSEILRDIVSDRIERIVRKFPEFDVNNARVHGTVIVSMENSPFKKGADHFTLKLILNGSGLKTIIIEKSAESMYMALALLTDHLIEVLHRCLEKRRELGKEQQRQFKRQAWQEGWQQASSY